MSPQVFALFLQFLTLHAQDDWMYTSNNLGVTIEVNQQYYVTAENDPIAVQFQAWHIAPEAHIIADVGIGTVLELTSDFDKQHLKGLPIGTSDLLVGGLNLIEKYCINDWVTSGLRHNRIPIPYHIKLAEIVF